MTLLILIGLTFVSPIISFAQDWSYIGKKGPWYWGRISEEYAICIKGKTQSPINIKQVICDLSQEKPTLSYFSGQIIPIQNKNHFSFQTESGNRLKYKKQEYELKLIDIHLPSEHKIMNSQFAMELQLIHEDEDGKILIVAFFIERGMKNHLFIDDLLKTFKDPLIKELEPVILNPAKLFTQKIQYLNYQGSLTTPPCTEDVEWLIVNQPIEIDSKTLARFTSSFKHKSNRPIRNKYQAEVSIF